MNKKVPFFSVVIPVHNKAPHIHRSVSSVLSQTFDDLELIFVNDASSDNSLEEMENFNDPRIRLLHRNVPGPGGYAARNLGIKEARGEWIAFLDADDEWYPEHLEKMHQLSIQYSNAYLLGCGWSIDNGSHSSQNDYFLQNKERGNHSLDAKTYFCTCLKSQRPIHTSVACVKAASPLAQDLFPAEKAARRGGDIYAWLKIMCCHKFMAWSAHLGAHYFRDTVNSVTKTAPSSPYLMSKILFSELSLSLDYDEKKYLKKYFNMQLRKGWIKNIRRNHQNFPLRPHLYWSGDIFNAFFFTTISFLPYSLLKSLLSKK